MAGVEDNDLEGVEKLLYRYRRVKTLPKAVIPFSYTSTATTTLVWSAFHRLTTSYVPSCFKWFGHFSFAQRILTCLNSGFELLEIPDFDFVLARKILKTVRSMLESSPTYLCPFVSEKVRRCGSNGR